MISNLKKSLLTAAALAASLAVATGAQAVTVSLPLTNYDVTNNTNTVITNVLMYETFYNGGSVTWPFSINPGTSTLTNPFAPSAPITSAVLFGLVDGTSDVVFGLSANTASLIQGQSWDSLFPNESESDLASAIALATSGGPFCDSSQVPGCINPNPAPNGQQLGLGEVFNFGGNDAMNIVYNGGTLNGQIQLPGNLSLIEFTDGQIIGSGTAFNTGVPEPATWTMLLLGFGAIGWTLRNSRKDKLVQA